MGNRKSITLDDVTIRRKADGKVAIAPRKGSGCITVGLLIVTGIFMLAILALTIRGALQLFNPPDDFNSGIVIFGLFLSTMLGSFMVFLYSKAKFGQTKEQINIIPILNIIKIGNREIPFRDVLDISSDDNQVEVMEMKEVAAVTFLLVLTGGGIVELGTLAVGNNKLDKRKEEIIAFLKEALKRS